MFRQALTAGILLLYTTFTLFHPDVSSAAILPSTNSSIAPMAAPFPPSPPVRGKSGDHWADVIIGKPDFSQIAMKSVVPFKVNNPTGVLVDRSVSPGRAYVWDSGNSRILGIDLAKCYAGSGPCTADIVIGQPSGYDHAACNGDNGVQNFPVRARPTAATLCGIPDHSLSPWEGYSFVTMAVDRDGNLYVPDAYNNRILKYENPFEHDSVADQMWGHADYSGMVCNRGDRGNPTAESLCFQSPPIGFGFNRHGAGVEIDADGNLWVADAGNHRALRFPAHPHTSEIAKAPDLVLGQANFRTRESGNTLAKFNAPSAIRFDSQGWLYVADTGNDRVLVFKPPSCPALRQMRHSVPSSIIHPPLKSIPSDAAYGSWTPATTWWSCGTLRAPPYTGYWARHPINPIADVVSRSKECQEVRTGLVCASLVAASVLTGRAISSFPYTMTKPMSFDFRHLIHRSMTTDPITQTDGCFIRPLMTITEIERELIRPEASPPGKTSLL